MLRFGACLSAAIIQRIPLVPPSASWSTACVTSTRRQTLQAGGKSFGATFPTRHNARCQGMVDHVRPSSSDPGLPVLAVAERVSCNSAPHRQTARPARDDGVAVFHSPRSRDSHTFKPVPRGLLARKQCRRSAQAKSGRQLRHIRRRSPRP